jgi:hypothetical protein
MTWGAPGPPKPPDVRNRHGGAAAVLYTDR